MILMLIWIEISLFSKTSGICLIPPHRNKVSEYDFYRRNEMKIFIQYKSEYRLTIVSVLNIDIIIDITQIFVGTSFDKQF